MSWFFSLSFSNQLGLLYLMLINITAFFFFGWDKLRSQVSSARRVSERMLWLLSIIGGSVGALCGMYFFRHKTKKLSFQAGIAVILAAQILLILFIMKES